MIELNVDAVIHKLKFADFVDRAGYGSDRCYHTNDSLPIPGEKWIPSWYRTSSQCNGNGCGHATGEGVDMSHNPFGGLPYGILRYTGEFGVGTGNGSGTGTDKCWRPDECSGASW